MPLIEDAHGFHIGDTDITAIYAGDKQVWPQWTPLDLPGLAAWIDPAQDGFADGQAIANYTSHDPTGRVFTAPATNMPTFRANSIGGKPRIEFNGSGLNTLADLGTEGFTFVFVSRTAIPTDYWIMWAYNYISDATYNDYEMRYPPSSLTVQMVIEYAATGTAASAAFVQQADTDYVTLMRADQTNRQIKLYINDVEQAVVSGVPSLLPTGPTPLAMGERGGWGWYYGLVAEALVLAGPISDTDRIKLTAYLRAKHDQPFPPTTTRLPAPTEPMP